MIFLHLKHQKQVALAVDRAKKVTITDQAGQVNRTFPMKKHVY